MPAPSSEQASSAVANCESFEQPRNEQGAAAAESGEFNVEALLADARRGDEACIGELLTRYRNYMLLVATTQIERRLQPRVSPSDIVQETMLKAHRHFAQFNGRSERELLAWLRQILLNNLAKFVERYVLAAKRDVRREIPLGRLEAALKDSSAQCVAVAKNTRQTPSAQAEHREEAVVLSQRMAQLPPAYREVLTLRNIQGLSFEETAARLDRTLGATRMLWLRAIERLRTVYRRAEEQDA